MKEIVLDLSHWNNVSNWQRMVDAGVKGVYLKASQGTGYKDDTFEAKYNQAKKYKLKVGAYHFVTVAGGTLQYYWFMDCIKGKTFDLTPALDCEGYSMGMPTQDITMLDGEIVPIESIEAIPYLGYRLENPSTYALGEEFASSLYFPKQKAILTIANGLRGFQGFPYPAIYTNVFSGNKIFTSLVMKVFPIWVASWGTKILLPNMWKGEKPYLWQDGVVNGAQYGVNGDVDHNVWQDKIPFPVDPVPPTEKIYYNVFGKTNKGVEIKGKLE